MPLRAFVDDLVPLLPTRNSPITKQKTGVQGYLFALPHKAGQLLCERLEFVVPVEQLIADTLTQSVPDETTRQAPSGLAWEMVVGALTCFDIGLAGVR